MKTAVIVTNRYHEDGATPIFKASMHDGKAYVVGDSGMIDFIVDFEKETVVGWWGFCTLMTLNEALRFGANFGLWFSS
jgi:hypothetical protein